MPNLNTIYTDYRYDLSEFDRLRRELPKFAESSTSVQAQYMAQISHAAMTALVKMGAAAGLSEPECKRTMEPIWSLQAARDVDDAYKHGRVNRGSRVVQEVTVTTKPFSEGAIDAAMPLVRVLKLLGGDGKEMTLDYWVLEVDRDLRAFASRVGASLPDDFGKD